MTSDEAFTDAERIELGLNPLQDDRLSDTDDLWRMLARLGHESGDNIPTTVWDHAVWTCPQDDCDGLLSLIDTRVRGLPADPADLDESVDTDDADLYQRISNAQSSTVPVVTCSNCNSVFEATFRRVIDPIESGLPEPRIVETPDTLGGRPRIAGTRIGVEHIWWFSERGDGTAEIATRHFPHLSEAHVSVAVEWAEDHPDRMERIRQENRELQLQHDIFQSVVQAVVEDCLEDLWSVLVNARSRDVDTLNPVTSLLRNGFEHADGLDIGVDTDAGTITIDVADKLVNSMGDFDTTDSSK
ncbi:DUF433 domain-containing protein [Halobellus sp. GM3]|uniref:DUF433 domain-containing protein n=1 Tax=Halobellus sp. GM3 TaxID=3458410 RepID=UPI00403E1383